jgi:hypothetical protein
METKRKRRKILLLGNAQHAKMLDMIDVIVQKKRFLQFRTYISDFVPLCIGFFTTTAELAVAVYS